MISSASSGSRLPVGSSAISTSGFAHDSTRDPDALLLTCRQFQRREIFLAEEPYLIERSPHAFVEFATAHARYHQRQCHVVEYGAIVQELAILEHDADLAAECRDATPGHAGECSGG